MLRVFGHYIAYPALFLAFLETLLFFCILYFLANVPLGLGLSIVAYEADTQLLTLLTAVNFLSMVSVGLYNRSVFFKLRSSIQRGAITFPLIFIVLSVFLYLYGGAAQVQTDAYYGVCMVAVTAFFVVTSIVRGIFIDVIDLDVFKRRVLVFGCGPLAKKIDELARHSAKGHFSTVGYIGFGEETSAPDLNPVLPEDLVERRHALAEFVRQRHVDEIVVAARERRRQKGKRGVGLPVWDLLECKMSGIRISTYSAFWERESGRIDLDELQPGWLIFGEGFRVNWFLRFVERTFDVVVSAAFLAFTLPIFLFTAIAIKFSSRGPVFYRQERVGAGGKTFRLLKFRSMREDAEKDGTPRWATADDDRITWIGHFIRKTRIDEMPQVINVLKGEMSFVGPRPERPYFVEALGK